MMFKVRAALAVFLAIGWSASDPGRAAAPTVQAAPPVEERCQDASTQADTLNCYLAALAKSRAEVEGALKRTLKIAKDQDRAFNAYARRHGLARSSLAARLKASQAAWRLYSNAQCAFEGGSSFGGSGEDLLAAACHDRLNSRRLLELKAAVLLFAR